MDQQDYLLNESRKFALLLARLLGLKVKVDNEEFRQQFNNMLQDEDNAELREMLDLPEAEFKEKLWAGSDSLEKLNALSQLLYMFAEPFDITEETMLLLKKVLVVFDILEKKHHFESFENIDKRNSIYRFLIQYHGQS